MSDLTRRARRTVVVVGAAAAVVGLGLAGPASAQTAGTGYQVTTDVQSTTQVRGGVALPSSSGSLPRTGSSNTEALVTGAGLLILGGGAAVHLGRTRLARR